MAKASVFCVHPACSPASLVPLNALPVRKGKCSLTKINRGVLHAMQGSIKTPYLSNPVCGTCALLFCLHPRSLCLTFFSSLMYTLFHLCAFSHRCIPGQYQPARNSSKCRACEHGRYQPAAGQTGCVNVANGFEGIGGNLSLANPGHMAEIQCSPGKYFNAFTCLECP